MAPNIEATPLSPLSESVGIIGAGPAGLINAHILIQDCFTDIHVITRDAAVGGVWARERVYSDLRLNNVHGEYTFSAMEMVPSQGATEDRHLTGADLCNYMEKYYDTFLKTKVNFIFNTEVLEISREQDGKWFVQTEDTQTHTTNILKFCRIIIATGGCSEPKIPTCLSPQSAIKCQYRGIVIHSSKFEANVERILQSVRGRTQNAPVVVIGGGKSAQDICVRLTRKAVKCCNVFETTDSFLAASAPLPDFIRRSRFLSTLSPHIHLRTRLERFLHGTKLGGKIIRFMWAKMQDTSLDAFALPSDSPLRSTNSLFWGVRTNDLGIPRPDSYHTLVTLKKIDVISPARAVGFSQDGSSILLNNGRSIAASAVILATGFDSSWSKIFSEQTAEAIGINRHAPTSDAEHSWNYPSLHGAPGVDSESPKWVTSIYRGIVPAKNILQRDFAIAGSLFSANLGYTNEVIAHWISSYFLKDKLRLPRSVEEAMGEAERSAIWMKTRYPRMGSWVNASYMGGLDFWTWPQAVDDLLEDMGLPIQRSGGNWFTWPFKVIKSKEISSLGDERREKRRQAS